jgi:alpha-D-ribose 1-methylphosphonate 5-triphosphate synthase subunit PhnG
MSAMKRTESQYAAIDILSILSQGRADHVKVVAEPLIEALDPVYVLKSRTGLVMLPYSDTAQGAVFHLGEVMASEAHIRVQDGVEGYGICMGRDLELAMALAIIDAALHCGVELQMIHALAAEEEAFIAARDDAILRDVATTRVEMETF